MQTNRRTMLACAMLAVAVTFTGCSSSTTKITFTNNSYSSLGVVVGVTYSGVPVGFDAASIAGGKSATGTYHASIPAGTILPLTGFIKVGNKTFPLSGNGLTVRAGSTNLFLVGQDPLNVYVFQFTDGVLGPTATYPSPTPTP